MTTKDDIDLGRTGAKQQTWEKRSARALLREIVEAHPDYDEEAIYHEMQEQCAAYFPEILRYWVTNNLKALRPRKRGEQTADRTASMEKTVGRMKMLLLDTVLPTGKMLRDSTFAEAGKTGGWLTRLSKCGQPGEIIGATMSEKEV